MGAEMIAALLIFGLPVVAIVTSHQRKMMEMKLRLGDQRQSAPSSELQDLRRAIDELRDTTTRYDISFDAALQRMDSRMNNVEQKLAVVEGEVQSAQRQIR
jgi:hypothetical protein